MATAGVSRPETLVVSFDIREEEAMGALHFRMAEHEDLRQIVRMLASDPLGSNREVYSEPLPAAYENAFHAIKADRNNELLVAVLKDSVVGVVQVTFIPSLTYLGRWRATLEGVRVESSVRSQGVGTALLRYAIGRAMERGCRLVQLTTDKAREDALRFYGRLGFVCSHHGLKLDLLKASDTRS